MIKRWKITKGELENLILEAYVEEPEAFEWDLQLAAVCDRSLGEEPPGYVEETLPPPEYEDFKAHLARCDFCVSAVLRHYRTMQYLATHEARIRAKIAEAIRESEPKRVGDPAGTATMVATSAVAAQGWILSRLVAATGRFRALQEKLQGSGASVLATIGVFANERTEAEFKSEDGSWIWMVWETEDRETIISVETTRSELAGALVRFALIQKHSGSERELAGGFMILHPAFVEGGCAACYLMKSRLDPTPWHPEVRTILPQDLSPADIHALKTSIDHSADHPSRQAWRDFIRSLSGLPMNAEVLQALTSSLSALPDAMTQ